MSELANAPETGGAEAVSAPEAAPAPASESKSSAPSKSTSTRSTPSAREALDAAFAALEADEPNETARAAAVLQNGAGADEKLLAKDKHTREEASKTVDEVNAASERAKKGWETRKANAEKAEAEAEKAAQTEQIAKAVSDKVVEATKPAETEKATPRHDAPKWMPKHVAAEWDKVPDAVREEVVKRSEAFDQGIAKFKGDAEAWAELKEFSDLSQQYYKQPLKDTLRNYAELDRMLHEDPLAAFERLANGMPKLDENGDQVGNWTLRELAEYVVSQDKTDFSNENADLKRTIQALERRISEFEKGHTEREQERIRTEAEQHTTSLQKQISEFAAKQGRWDELFPAIEEELHNPKFAAGLDPLARLQKAYEKAERLNPAPSISPPAPDITAPDLAAQTRKATASITGSPGAGSTPGGKRPAPATARDAVDDAFARLGL